MRRFINICAEIEKTVGHIYQLLSATPYFEPKIRQMFLTLANDEHDHAQQLDFSLRMPTDIYEDEQLLSMEQAQNLLRKVEKSLKEISGQSLSLIDAVDLGIELEGDFCRIHLNNAVNFKDKNLKKMFSAMARSEELHKQQLLELKTKLDGLNQ